MTNYRIEAFYETGDSFHTERTSTVLSPVWTNLDKAKKALLTLKEHHDYYNKDQRHYYTSKVTDKDLENLKKMPWYIDKYWHYSLKLEGDEDGSEMISDAPYHGYFEHLETLKIIVETPEETDMEINF